MRLEKNPSKNYYPIIDEVNRGSMARINGGTYYSH